MPLSGHDALLCTARATLRTLVAALLRTVHYISYYYYQQQHHCQQDEPLLDTPGHDVHDLHQVHDGDLLQVLSCSCGVVELWICGFVDLWICGVVQLWSYSACVYTFLDVVVFVVVFVLL